MIMIANTCFTKILIGLSFITGSIQILSGQSQRIMWQTYQQDTLLQTTCNNRVHDGHIVPEIVVNTKDAGYNLSIQGKNLMETIWFDSQGQINNSYVSKHSIDIKNTLDFYYAVVIDSLGCVFTTDPIRPGVPNNSLPCEDTCNITSVVFMETFTQPENCNSAYNFPQASDHTFSGLSLNGPSCTVHPMIQQLNPLLPEGLFYLEDYAGNINPFWNRADASTPSDAFLIGDPWDYPEIKIWHHDFPMIAGDIYCFSVKVSNVQNNQSSGFLPVVDLRFSDLPGFQWPSTFQLFGQPLTLRHSDGWMTLSGSFQATVTGIHRIAIVNNATVNTNTNGIGRNLAIDDLTLIKVDNALPILSASQSIICEGDTVTLNAISNIPNYVCTWSTMPPSPPIHACTFTAAPNVSTLYYLGAGDQGCVTSVFVKVKPRPEVKFNLVKDFCEGDSAKIDLQFSGIGPWLFEFSDGKTHSTTTAGNSPYNLTLSPNGTNIYTILNISADGCSDSIPSTFVLNPIPIPTAHLTGNAPLNLGQQATLSIILSGTPPWDIVWTDGIGVFPINGITQSPYLLSVTPIINSTYSLTSVKNFCIGHTYGSIIAGETHVSNYSDLNSETEFKIIPNPSIGNYIHIYTPIAHKLPDNILIYDMLGKVIPFELRQLSDSKIELRIPSECDGIYTIHLQIENKIQRIQCIINRKDLR